VKDLLGKDSLKPFDRCAPKKKLSKAKGLVEILRVFFGELKLKEKSVNAGCQLRVTYIWLCVQQFEHLGH
jgi:hypothetical protein